MCLQCLGRLLSVDRLQDLNVNPTCVFCQAAIESRDHLFGECTFAKDLWVRLLNWMQIQPGVTATWNQ